MGFLEFFNEHFIKTKIDYKTWHNQLTSQGWERKGEGAFGVAYVHPNKDYIYKIFRHDPGYDFFLKFALENQNDRGVVKLKRIVLSGKGEEDIYLSNDKEPNVIVLEKLIPLSPTKTNYEVVFNACSLIFRSLNSLYKDGMSFEEAIAQLLQYAKNEYAYYVRLEKQDNKGTFNRRDYSMKQWRRMIHIMRSPFIFKMPIFRTIFNLFLFKKQNENDRYWDLHSGNLMIRESTGEVVLTDPFV